VLLFSKSRETRYGVFCNARPKRPGFRRQSVWFLASFAGEISVPRQALPLFGRDGEAEAKLMLSAHGKDRSFSKDGMREDGYILTQSSIK
jgi:hypothetical protein